VIAALRAGGHDVVDVGAHSDDAVDYPDVAKAVEVAVITGTAEGAVLLCGSRVGAAPWASREQAARLATKLLRAFLAATFPGAERHHTRRLAAVRALEARRGYARE
jgi:ribose 5-phosphate isomerase RpiB